MQKLKWLLLLSGMLGSCGRADSGSKPSWIAFPNSSAFSGVDESIVKLCVVKTPNVAISSVTLAKRVSASALLAWVRALKKVDPYITSSVAISCTKPHYTLKLYTNDEFTTRLRKDGRSFVSGREGNTIYSHEGNISYNIYLHEFGHAFAGLGDTYVEGKFDQCKPGQPKSIMCSHYRFGGVLMADDLAGLKAQYQDKLTSLLLKGGFEKRYGPSIRQLTIHRSQGDIALANFRVKGQSINYAAGKPSIVHVTLVSQPDYDGFCAQSLKAGISVPWPLNLPKSVALQKFKEGVEAKLAGSCEP